MQRMFKSVLLMGSVLVLTGQVAGQDDPKALINKAIAALGGAEKLDKFKGARTSGKGTISIQGMEIEFTNDTVAMEPDKEKSTLQLQLGGMNVTVVQLSNGSKFSLMINSMAVPLQDAQTADMKNSVELHKIMNLTPLLKDSSYELKMLPAIKVEDKEAVGVEVNGKNIKGVKLYFDKATNLVVKVEHKGLDPATNMGEVAREIILSDYKDVQGIKHPMKSVAFADGKKFMESTTTKVELFEKIDDSEFSD